MNLVSIMGPNISTFVRRRSLALLLLRDLVERHGRARARVFVDRIDQLRVGDKGVWCAGS